MSLNPISPWLGEGGLQTVMLPHRVYEVKVKPKPKGTTILYGRDCTFAAVIDEGLKLVSKRTAPGGPPVAMISGILDTVISSCTLPANPLIHDGSFKDLVFTSSG